MEKVKEFFSNTKKTAMLALIMNIVAVIVLYMISNYYGILMCLRICSFNIGTIIYFIIIVLRLYKKKGNIKVANYILVIFFALNALLTIISTIQLKSTIGGTSYIVYIVSTYMIETIIYTILTLYFCKILLKIKIPIIDNIIFIAAILIFVSNVLISGINTHSVTFALAYLSIIPYFYNYYELLERSNQNGKQ